jgi:hypothetical protein
LEEELNIEVDESKLEGLAEVIANITIVGQKQIVFTTYLFSYVQTTEKLTANDDLDAIRLMTPTELVTLIGKYRELDHTTQPILNFSWADCCFK